MYGLDPPKVLNSEVFAVLPKEFQQTIPGRRGPLRQGKTGTTLERPSFDREGNLYITDIHNGRIFRVSAEAAVTLIAEYDGEPNGLRIHRDGRIFIADQIGRAHV